MANSINAALNYQPPYAKEDGNVAVYTAVMTPASAALNEIWRFMKLPAGLKPHRVVVKALGDMDTGGPNIAYKAGYTYADGSAVPSGADEVFAAAGQTGLGAAPTQAGNIHHFKPFVLAKDAFLDIVITTAAAAYAAQEVMVIVEGEMVGPK